jgi:hypothetical protein
MAFVRGKGKVVAWLGRVAIAVLLGVLLHYAWDGAALALRIRGALRTLAANEAGPGPALVYHGTARRAAPTVPASDTKAIAWLGTISEWRGSGKSRSLYVTCVVARVDGLMIEEASTHKIVTLDGWDQLTGGFPRGLRLAPGMVAVDLISERTVTVPTHVANVCGASVPTQPVYTERYLEDGAHVTVRGCLAGDVLRPCGDGIDVLTAGTLAHVAYDTRTSRTGELLFYTLGGGVGLLVVGIIARRRLVRVTRRTTEKGSA